MKVLVADKLSAEAVQTLREGGAQVDDRSGIEAAELAGALAGVQGLIVRSRTKVTADLLKAASDLKVVGRAGVGVDNIDVAAAAERGVAVVNTPVSTSVAVAELTFALMLALVRELPRADDSMKRNLWIKKELEGSELAGKTLGILGVGNIGSQVARRAAAFDMRVVGFDPFLDDGVLKQRGVEPMSLEAVYEAADIITLHLPLLADTRRMLDQQAFDKMKRGVLILCAARGGVIDEADLLAALNSGQVGGAGLDVFEKEPPGASPLVAHPRVVATPHIGAQTAEAQTRAAVDVAEEVLNALHGRPLRWQVKAS
jgi:D-3-phosphoglycerate dehydrogenase